MTKSTKDRCPLADLKDTSDVSGSSARKSLYDGSKLKHRKSLTGRVDGVSNLTKQSKCGKRKATTQLLAESSGRTPGVKKRLSNPNYKLFPHKTPVNIYVSRIPTCDTCEKNPATIIEHCHRTGCFRGHVCASCNAREREALRETRDHFKMSRADYESGKAVVSDEFWTMHGTNFAKRVPGLTPEEGIRYVTGKTWSEELEPLALQF